MSNVFSNVIFLVGEKFLTTLILLVSNIVVIRYLGVEDFGYLALFQLYYAIAVSISEFGIRRVYSSIKSRSREEIVFNEAFRIKCLSSLVFCAIAIGYIHFSHVRQEYYALVFAFLASPFEIYTYHFEANLRNQILSKIRVSVSIFLALLRIILCLYHAPFILIVLSFAINNMLINFLGMYYAKKNAFRPRKIRSVASKKVVRQHLFGRSFFFWISVIVVQLNLRTDQFMISMLSGAASVGIYAGAYKLIEQLMTIPSILAGVFLPHLSKNAGVDKKRYLEDLYLYSFLVCLPISLFGALIAPWIIPAMLGEQFVRSVPIFQVLVITLPVLIMVNLSGLYYSVFKLEKYAFIRNISGLIISLAFNFMFIKLFGIVGAAFSVLVSYSCVAFVIEWFNKNTRENAQLKLNVLRRLCLIRTYEVIFKNAKVRILKKKNG